MEEVICKFCHQFFEEPVFLECTFGHPICSKCAQAQFSFELLRKPWDNFPLKTEHKQDKKPYDEKRSVDIYCPVCNEKTTLLVTQGISKLTRDTSLAEKAKKAQEPKVSMCSEECGHQATLYCENCEENFCQACYAKWHSVQKRKNHKSTNIDSLLPAKRVFICPKHGHSLDIFCKTDQVTCCYECLESDEHKNHEITFVNRVVSQAKIKPDQKLVEISKQINQIKQALSNMSNLKEQVSKLHMQFTSQVKSSFNPVIKQLENKRDALVTESEKMESTTLSNINFQQEALTDLLRQKINMIEQANKWLSGDDLQENYCKQLLQNNQEIIESMLICCESGKISTSINVSQIEQIIDKIASICKIPLDIKLPIINGLKELSQDENNVIVQWDPTQCDFAEMYIVIQMRADNDDTTVKNFKVTSDVTSLQVPIGENWKQLVFTARCVIDDNLQGMKCAPLEIDLICNDPEAILLHIKEICSQTIYERVEQVFRQNGTQLDLFNCNVIDVSAIAVSKMLPHLTQLQKLYLSNNRIGDSGATAIANGISKFTQLQQLNFMNNQIEGSGASAIANSLSKLTQLQLLYIGSNQIGDNGGIAIGNALSGLTRLQWLHLGSTLIRDAGAIAIANSLGNLRQLQVLYLSYNQFGDSGATAIANATYKLEQLQQLTLFDDKNVFISEPVKQQLKQLLCYKLA